jgi:hypothetical protein
MMPMMPTHRLAGAKRSQGTGMARGLDHIVHAVRDLDAAAEIYRRLGFSVGARNRHPCGTHNHIFQLPSFFMELLTLAVPDILGPDIFSRFFGAYTRDFTARHDGFSTLIFESQDAIADGAMFATAGIAIAEPARFDREGKRPDGSPVQLGFSLAFAGDIGAPEIGFATCQQHRPENFWNPTFQRHANSASGVAGVVAVANEPSRHLDFMQRFTGVAAGRPDFDGFALGTPRGVIEVVTPDAFLARFGVKAPDVAQGARLAALRFTVTEPSLLDAVPELAGLGGINDGTVIGPQDAMGAVLVFEAAR